MQKKAEKKNQPMLAEGISPFRPRVHACTESMLANPRAFALFLDVDGTLLELAATPRSVRIPDGLSDLLQTLMHRLDGAVAIISGRLISEIDQIVAPTLLPASGVHGAELRKGPAAQIERISPELPDDVVQSLRTLALSIPGVIAEPKGPGLAIHYRLAPHAEADILSALAAILDAHAGALELLPGKRLFEIIPSGLSKGTALTALASLPAFRGRVPIMVGDDIGDDAAFAVAERMGGYGLRVAGEYFNTEVADFGGPRSVMGWLNQIAHGLTACESIGQNS
jgi:trehalose 6-phosphate phosphatase